MLTHRNKINSKNEIQIKLRTPKKDKIQIPEQNKKMERFQLIKKKKKIVASSGMSSIPQHTYTSSTH